MKKRILENQGGDDADEIILIDGQPLTLDDPAEEADETDEEEEA